MTSPFIAARNAAEKFFYKKGLKQFFFRFDPEDVHDRLAKTGARLGASAFGRGLMSAMFNYRRPALQQTVAGIRFLNPIGLAAGFDKNAELTQILASVGFGFEEVGSITGEPCLGNPRPRLWRLRDSQSLVVYYGLKNDGCEAIAGRMKRLKFRIPIGISVAKTNSPATVEDQAGIADYAKAYKVFADADIGDYFTINISCPNAFGGEPFTDPGKLDRLLDAIYKIPAAKPVFLKMPAELPFPHVDEIIAVARKYGVTGFVCTNLAKNRDNRHIKEPAVPEQGGLSGKVVQELSDNLVQYIYGKTRGEFVIIGCGGVFSAEDAYRKIKLGASLIQLITGMIFEGPEIISEINRGLVELLHRDGYQNIAEAVGKGI